MAGFDAIYKQTVTLFNRVKMGRNDDTIWYPTVIEKVHLVVDKSSQWNMQGGTAADNVRLHIRYDATPNGPMIRCKDPSGEQPYILKAWKEPKEWRRQLKPEEFLTFGYGDDDNFDFFIEGVYEEGFEPISDNVDMKGFYHRMNAMYDNVFAIKSVSKCNLLPHFEIMAR